MERSKVIIMDIMSKGKHLFRIPYIFSLSWNRRIGLYGIIVEFLRSFFSMTINSMISLFTILLYGLLALKAFHVMEVMYKHFTLGLSSSSVLTYLPLPLATTSIVFLGDFFFIVLQGPTVVLIVLG